ncbi:MAG: class I SAM-dependent methyltransferase [Candidatus Lokiarchaeota archaeon]|nr:class I SAM-dependent methyltransferase [Candidatus Lokiarchaeota archaeon]
MSDFLLSEFNLDFFRNNLIKYSIKAFKSLPKLDKPRILDVGCGSGVSTIELTNLCNGIIVGIDIISLEKLDKKIKEKGLTNQIKLKQCSFFKNGFQDESFDIVWAEGTFHILGYEKSFNESNRLLKRNGYLVIHDETNTLPKKIKLAKKYDFKLINSFPLPEKAWWSEYYQPLEKKIYEILPKYEKNNEVLKYLKQQLDEVNMVKHDPKKFNSIFFIFQKA